MKCHLIVLNKGTKIGIITAYTKIQSVIANSAQFFLIKSFTSKFFNIRIAKRNLRVEEEELKIFLRNKIPISVIYLDKSIMSSKECDIEHLFHAIEPPTSIICINFKKNWYCATKFQFYDKYNCLFCNSTFNSESSRKKHVTKHFQKKILENEEQQEDSFCLRVDLRKKNLKRIKKAIKTRIDMSFDLETVPDHEQKHHICIIGFYLAINEKLFSNIGHIDELKKKLKFVQDTLDSKNDIYNSLIEMNNSSHKVYAITADIQPNNIDLYFLSIIKSIAQIIYPTLLHICGFNNSNFDNFFLKGLVNKTLFPRPPNFIIFHGRLLQIQFQNKKMHFIINDLFKFDAPKKLQQSVGRINPNLGKDNFDVNLLIFAYRLNTGYPLEKLISIRREAEKYCMVDCICTLLICHYIDTQMGTAQKDLYEICDIPHTFDLFQCCSTASGFTMLMFGLAQKDLIYFPSNECANLIMECIQGGRVELGVLGEMKGEFVQPDISTMYAQCMNQGLYGKGPFIPLTWSTKEHLNQSLLESIGNENYNFTKILPSLFAFVFINLPEDTSNLPTISPKLFKCQVTEENKAKRTMLGGIHSTGDVSVPMGIVDMFNISRAGYIVTVDFNKNGFEQTGGWYKPFNDYLTKVIHYTTYYGEIKNNAVRETFKLLGNGLAGKMMEKPQKTTTHILDAKQAEELFYEKLGESRQIFIMPSIEQSYDNNQNVLMSIGQETAEPRAPIHFGATLLAWSRSQFYFLSKINDHQRKAKIPLKDRFNHIIYSDTDCCQLYYHPDNITHLPGISIFDDETANWSYVAAKIEHVTKKFISLGKKLRILETQEGEFIVKAKGQNINLLTYEDFENVLHGENTSTSRLFFEKKINFDRPLIQGELTRNFQITDYICAVLERGENMIILRPMSSIKDATILGDSNSKIEILRIGENE